MAITEYETKQLKLNTDLRGYKAGQVLTVRSKGKILSDPYWRRRVKDAEIDNCVEIVTKKKKENNS